MNDKDKKVYIVSVFDNDGDQILFVSRNYESALKYFNKIKKHLEEFNNTKYCNELTLKWFLEDTDGYLQGSCGILMDIF